MYRDVRTPRAQDAQERCLSDFRLEQKKHKQERCTLDVRTPRVQEAQERCLSDGLLSRFLQQFKINLTSLRGMLL